MQRFALYTMIPLNIQPPPLLILPTRVENLLKIISPTLLPHYYSKCVVYIRVHLWCCAFYELRQIFINMYLPLQCHTKQFYSPNKPLCSLPIHPFLLLYSCNSIILCFYDFEKSSISHKQNQRVLFVHCLFHQEKHPQDSFILWHIYF